MKQPFVVQTVRGPKDIQSAESLTQRTPMREMGRIPGPRALPHGPFGRARSPEPMGITTVTKAVQSVNSLSSKP